jgi:cellulose synthase/poly-beta-1,6-N-acetylglucosamine synthase-like glycosyltransferase
MMYLSGIILPLGRLIFYGAFVFFVLYFLILTAYYLFLAIVGFIEVTKRARESKAEIYPMLAAAATAMPVSIVIPARNEEEWIADALGSALRLEYPEFEIIVVDDGSTDRTLEILNEMLVLKGCDSTYVKEFASGHVREVLKSEKYPFVTVVTASQGRKKAGAVNLGLNFAKNKYICVIDADEVIEPDALMKAMIQVQRDPEKVIGTGSYFGLLNGFKVKDGVIIDRSFSYKPLIAYQNLEYIRSFIGNRIAWSKFNAMPNVAGGFGIWRRDIVRELGGYNREFTCEDIEFTFRAHDYIIKNKEKGYRILMMPYVSGWTEGPSNVKSFIIQRNRWQRVIDETIWHFKYMAFNPKYGYFGFLTLPYYILYEVLGVFVEIASVFFVLLGVILGILQMNAFLAYLCLMILSQAFISILCLFSFVRHQKFLKLRYVLYLIGLSFVEFFWYRWLVSFAKIAGTISYQRKDKEYTMYKREKRKP